MKHEDLERIESYINKEVDDSEKEYVESLFYNGETNLYLRQSLERDWDRLLRNPSETQVNLSHLLDHVHHLIRKNETYKRQKPLQKFVRFYMRTAAILLLPLLITGGLIYSNLASHKKAADDIIVGSTIFAPMGSRVTFNLPDGTTGMLNSGSKLSYSLPFASNRQVNLEGEAWFEVKHDEDHPFEIGAGKSRVKVAGTSFNLSAYPAENYIEVVLQDGEVGFIADGGDKKVTILPSERMVFQNGKISQTTADPEKYNAWTDGKLVFRGDNMAEVARRIERWYNVKIKIADRELEKYSFRATFEDDKLEDVLRFLSLTSPIRCNISPREIMADGTIKKEEVTIYKRK